jgi:hypothetical protein
LSSLSIFEGKATAYPTYAPEMWGMLFPHVQRDKSSSLFDFFFGDEGKGFKD